MITTEEKQLGKRFALGALIFLLANFLIQVLVLGPEATGYNETWGPIIGLVGALQLMAGMGVIRLSGKLLDDKDKPLLTGSIGVGYTVAAVGLVMSLVPAAVHNAFNDTALTADMAANVSPILRKEDLHIYMNPNGRPLPIYDMESRSF